MLFAIYRDADRFLRKQSSPTVKIITLLYTNMVCNSLLVLNNV